MPVAITARAKILLHAREVERCDVARLAARAVVGQTRLVAENEDGHVRFSREGDRVAEPAARRVGDPAASDVANVIAEPCPQGVQHGGNVVLVVGDRRVGSEGHGEHVPAALQHLAERLDVGMVRVVPEEVAADGSVRPDDCDPTGSLQREDAVVAQQHDALRGDLAGEGTVRRRVAQRLRRGRFDRPSFEQAELELRAKDAANGGVDRREGQPTRRDRFAQWRAEAVGAGQLDVEPGVDRYRGGLDRIGGDPVKVGELPYGEVVRDHAALEAPFVAQDRGQEVAIGEARDPVDLLIHVHHRAGTAVAHNGFERPQVDVSQLALADVRGRPVETALRCAVTDEVLGRGDDARRAVCCLQAADEGDPHRGHEVWVLAERLLGAPPARVAAHVEHGREALVGAHGPHLLANRVAERRGERRVPRARQADGLREDRRLSRHQPAADLLVHDGRDAEPGPRGEVLLDRVGERRGFSGCEAARPEIRVIWPIPSASTSSARAASSAGPSASWKTQALPSWATFSAVVIRASRSSMRSVIGRVALR